MNEQPILKAYAKPDMGSFLIAFSYLMLCIMLFSLFDNMLRYIVIMSVVLAITLITNARNRRKGIPALKIYEDRIERRFLWQKEYKRYYFEELSSATLKYEFPMYDVLRLEFKDARKPVMIQMTNLSVAVEDMYRSILERI